MKATKEAIENMEARTAGYVALCHKDDKYMKEAINRKKEYPYIALSDCNSGLDWIARNNFHIAICRKSLMTLYCSTGSAAAFDLLMGYNKTVTLEDLASEVYIAIMEEYQNGNIDIVPANDNKHELSFINDDVKKRIFNTTWRVLYSMQVRHYKRTYVELDDGNIIFDSIPQLINYETADKLLDSPFYNSFCGYIRKYEPKNADEIILLISFRILGYSGKDTGIKPKRREYLMRLARNLYIGYSTL